MDQDHYLPLHKACLQKDAVKVGRLLYKPAKKLVDVDELDHHRRTPLILACKVGSETVVFQLLDRGASNLDAKDVLGKTALLYAADIDKHTIVTHLLARGANPNLPDGTGATPLIVASKHGFANAVRVLIKHGLAWINHADRHGATALWYACYYGNETVVEMLLQARARPNYVGTHRKTPIIAAAEQMQTACAKLLLEHPYIVLDAVDHEGKTALRYAGETNNLELVRLLIQTGADLNARTTIDHTTTLMAACSLGHLRIVDELLNDPSIRIDATDYADRTALYHACPYTSIVKKLVEKEASVRGLDRFHKTVLMRAAQIGNLDTLKILLGKKPDIDCIDADGHTALAYASIGGHPEAVALLLDHDADPAIADNDDATPLILAAKHGHADVVDRLMGYVTGTGLDICDYQGRTAVAHASIRGHASIVECLLKNNATAWLPDHQETTPLMHACIHNHPLVVRLFSEKIDAVDKTGHTALYYAAREEALECARILVSRHASPGLANAAGIAPFLVACMTGHLAMVKLLADTSDVDQRDQQGKSGLYHACDGGHTDVVTFLIDRGACPLQPCVYGKTPLMLAAAADNDAILRRLLATNAKTRINDLDGDACNSLYYAAEQGLATCVDLLVKHGADVSRPCDGGNTPCLVAAERGFADVVKLVLCHRPNDAGKTPLHKACTFGHRDIVIFLLKHGADINNADHQGNTPLLLACMRKHLDVAETLLKHPTAATTINKPNHLGRTALFYAVSNHILPMVALLHRHGADVHMLVQNQTLWATGYPQYCTLGMIKKLVDDFHLDVNASNPDGKTALLCQALAFGNKASSIALLLSRGANPWIASPSGMLPVAAANNDRVRGLLQDAMMEHERFFTLEKARVLCQHDAKSPRPTPRVTWNAAPDSLVENVLGSVIHDMNDDLFRELWMYMKVPWE
jgi:ankyrin repeat protein